MAETKIKTYWKNFIDSISTKKEVKMDLNTGNYNTLFAISFTGEKNLGEMGPIKGYIPAYEALRQRSWDAYLTNEIVQIIVNRKSTWVIGKGLKLQSEPLESVLKTEGITIDVHDFSEMVESRFMVYAKSDMCDYRGMKNMAMLENTAYKNVVTGGDVLVILRYVKDQVKIQLIDGAHVRSPLGYGTDTFPQVLESGNRILNGIEMDPTGQHVAYYVMTCDPANPYKWERVEARGSKSNLKMAFLVSGLEYRIDNARSIPAISTTLETLAKLERYKEATLGSAEERQKIVYAIEHKEFSDGGSPLADAMARANGFSDKLPVTDDGVALASTVAASTNKNTFNLTKGSSLKSLESKNELYFRDFYSVNFDLICASIGMPPEVAASKYDSNFSSARAAIKDWEHTLMVEREKFAFEFLAPIYRFWLEVEILKNKVNAPGYLQAKFSGNQMVLEAYCNARFVGASVPHIDPLKEAEAERLKLGDTGKSIPLTTVEAATENLNGGDSRANMAQYASELQKSKDLKIVPVVDPVKEKKPGDNN
jgi:capsid protein